VSSTNQATQLLHIGPSSTRCSTSSHAISISFMSCSMVTIQFFIGRTHFIYPLSGCQSANSVLASQTGSLLCGVRVLATAIAFVSGCSSVGQFCSLSHFVICNCCLSQEFCPESVLPIVMTLFFSVFMRSPTNFALFSTLLVSTYRHALVLPRRAMSSAKSRSVSCMMHTVVKKYSCLVAHFKSV